MEAMFDWGMKNKEKFTEEYNIIIDENLKFSK